MPDQRGPLQARFSEQHRFANFGDVLTKITIRGFRGHAQTIIDIKSPITAFSGLNGCGKSTIVELAAAAYQRAPDLTYQVSQFFAVGPLDPRPFTDDASVVFEYWQADRSTKTVTLSRSAAGPKWNGYRRRLVRNVTFLSSNIHSPRVERRDFVIREARRLQVERADALNEVAQKACMVLSQIYNSVEEKHVRFGPMRAHVLCTTRDGLTYSETHMGCGEGRVHALIRELEQSPEKSLIILEEPESALHQSAQYRLGQYLVDLSIRRGHQILLTTHSDLVLRALPQASTIFLHKAATGVVPITGIPPAQSLSLLTEGHHAALTILVEDECAKVVLAELIRSIDPAFVVAIRIVVAGFRDDAGRTVGGGQAAIKTALKALADSGIRVAAVLDGDAAADTPHFVFKLPGTLPPERELLGTMAVKNSINDAYGVNVENIVAGYGAIDHHDLIPKLAEHLKLSEADLLGQMARAYSSALVGAEPGVLVASLKDAAART